MKKSAIFFSCIFIISTLFAQEALKSTEEEYYDFLSLTGVVARPTLGYRTLSDSVWELDEDEEHVWQGNNLGTTFTLWQPDSQSDNWFTRGIFQGLKARIYGPEWFNSYNTAAPYGQNDGALWQGVGYNTSLTTGLRLEGYGFELTFKPQLSWMQNKAFKTNPDIYPSPYSYTFKSGNVYLPIDFVQRYGDKAFWNYDWGDSEIRWTWHTLTFGFGTQNPWLGPAYLNPMLGSNNASGYPKLDIGLRKTEIILPFCNWNLGCIEGRVWTGMLDASDYFFINPETNTRMLNALSGSYEPSFIPNLTLGVNRVFITRWATHNLKYLGRLFTLSRTNGSQVGTNEDEDQKASLFIFWTFPKVGFNFYGELGIDDFSSNPTTNPFHTAIYTIGIKQIIPLKIQQLFPNSNTINELTSELIIEWNNFEMSQDFQLQWHYTGYYSHGEICQGYTQKGQILGAGTGSLGNSQLVQYKIYYQKGFTSIKFHRYCPNTNCIYNQSVKTSSEDKNVYKKWYANNETYVCYGIESAYFVTNTIMFDLIFDYVTIYRQNYTNLQYVNNFNFGFKITINLF